MLRLIKTGSVLLSILLTAAAAIAQENSPCLTDLETLVVSHKVDVKVLDRIAQLIVTTEGMAEDVPMRITFEETRNEELINLEKTITALEKESNSTSLKDLVKEYLLKKTESLRKSATTEEEKKVQEEKAARTKEVLIRLNYVERKDLSIDSTLVVTPGEGTLSEQFLTSNGFEISHWDLKKNIKIKDFPTYHNVLTTQIKIDPTQKWVATVAYKRPPLTFISLETGKVVEEFFARSLEPLKKDLQIEGLDKNIYSLYPRDVEFSHDSQYFVINFGDQLAVLYGTKDRKPLRVFYQLDKLAGSPRPDILRFVRFVGDTNQVITGHHKTFHIWSPDSNTPVKTLLPDFGASRIRMPISLDGEKAKIQGTSMVCPSFTEEYYYVNLAAKTLAPRRIPFDKIVQFFSFSPDGKFAAVTFKAKRNKNIEIWSLKTRKKVATLDGPEEPLAQPIRWSPDGKLVFGRLFDHSITIWDPANGMRIQTLANKKQITDFYLLDGINHILQNASGVETKILSLQFDKEVEP